MTKEYLQFDERVAMMLEGEFYIEQRVGLVTWHFSSPDMIEIEYEDSPCITFGDLNRVYRRVLDEVTFGSPSCSTTTDGGDFQALSDSEYEEWSDSGWDGAESGGTCSEDDGSDQDP
jgi:hypothetical protein